MAGPIFTKASRRPAAAAALVVIVVVAVVAGAAYLSGWRLSYQPTVASCVVDDGIDSGTRQAIDQTALDFVGKIAGVNPIAAYGMLTAETKGSVSPDKFLGALRSSLTPVEPLTGTRVAHAYLVHAPAGAAVQRVICGNLDDPDRWVAVSARPAAEQAHLIVEANAKGGRWAFVLWLLRDADWHVQGFNFAATGMAGKSGQDILGLARAEHGRNHDFNAVLLYGAAAQLAKRGNDLQLGIESQIETEMAKLPMPSYLQGKPPLGWKFDDRVYRIINVGPAGAGDKMYLAITQEITPWTTDQDADKLNRGLIADFAKAIPEFSAVFTGLIVVARDQAGTHLYRTVATNEPGAKAGPAPQ